MLKEPQKAGSKKNPNQTKNQTQTKQIQTSQKLYCKKDWHHNFPGKKSVFSKG